MTGDLHDATVYYTVYGDDEEKTATAAALESAKGVLRSEVGRQTGVRFTPTLTFVADLVPEDAARIEDLLARANQADAGVHAQATRAQYAADADPYRKPRDLDDDDADELAASALDVDDSPRRGRRSTRPPAATPADEARGPRVAGLAARRRQARRPGAPTTSSPGCGASSAAARSATPAPSTRWPPASWCSASSGPPGCSACWP